MKINDFTEDSPYAMFKRWASKTSQPRQYEKAAQTLHNVLVKKSRNGNLKHGLGYYAQQIGKSFAGIDYRALVDYYKEHYGTEGLAEFKIVKPDTKDTMGIKRNQMPQVATKDYPEFLDYLKDNGATFTKDTVPADSLKAIQGEFSDQGVEKALRLSKIEKPIIASSDNYIIDGHHRWLAALNTGVDVNIFRVDIPGKQLLQLVKDFPKTTYKDIYTEAKVKEGAEITMWTNPEYQGSDVDDEYYNKQPAKIIDVNKLTPFEPADKMDDEISAANMGKLVKAIQAGEKINPVVITKHQGKWLIIDGHHRYFAHLKAGVDKIRVVVADPKDLTWRDDVPIDEAYEINDSLVDKFLKATGGKYGKRDMCGPACLDFIDWAKQQGIELKRVRGEFVADEVVSAKADFTPEMKKEFAQSGLDWNSAADRKAWIEQSKYAEEWKRVPHYWTVDKDGNIHDPSGYQQLVKTGLASDLDPGRYIPESINEAKEIEFVCVNPAHNDATKQHEQDALFQALKDVPGVIVYRQDFDIHNSMAAILKSNADVKEIKALAKKHNVKIDLTKNVSDRFIDALYTGDLEGVTDWYDSDNLNEADEVIPMLYHATYKPFLDSIMKNGLGGKGAQTQWEDSKPGYVYLAKDPEVAVSHAEANEEVPDEYIDNIVVLSIDASQLDQDNLEDDPNVMDDDSTLAYKGIIPTSAFSVNESSSKDNYGIPDGATLAQLDKIAKTAKNPEKRERAHWLRNMRRGKNKK